MAPKADDAHRWISERILSGEFLPRQPLNADELARRLGISKIPVREALQRLTADGLVHYRHNTGATVAPLSWRELAGIRVLRGAIEPEAARLAALDHTDTQLAALHEELTTMADLVGAGHLDQVLERNRQFHLHLAEASGLPMVAEFVDRALRKVTRYRAVLPFDPAAAAAVLVDHREIVTAIEARDPAAAESAVRRHVTGEHTIAGEADRIRPELFEDRADDHAYVPGDRRP